MIRAHAEGATTLAERHLRLAPAGEPPGDLPLDTATREFRRDYVCGALDEHRGNISETARVLDLERSHLYRLIDKLDLRGGST